MTLKVFIHLWVALLLYYNNICISNGTVFKSADSKRCERYQSVACSYFTILDIKNCHVKPSYCLLENGFIFSANFIHLPSRKLGKPAANISLLEPQGSTSICQWVINDGAAAAGYSRTERLMYFMQICQVLSREESVSEFAKSIRYNYDILLSTTAPFSFLPFRETHTPQCSLSFLPRCIECRAV